MILPYLKKIDKVEVLKYAALNSVGLLIDIIVSMSLVYLFHLSLVIAGFFGLLTVSVTNYFFHLKVTFRSLNLKPSWKGQFKYMQSCAAGAIARLLTLGFFSLFPLFPEYISILIAIGVSFIVNYLLSKHYVFIKSS